jgi:hypothetical protein
MKFKNEENRQKNEFRIDFIAVSQLII